MPEEKKVEKLFCQYCKIYDRKVQKCKKTGEFTRRKATCSNFEKR